MSEETGLLALLILPALLQSNPQFGQLAPPQDLYAIAVRICQALPSLTRFFNCQCLPLY